MKLSEVSYYQDEKEDLLQARTQAKNAVAVYEEIDLQSSDNLLTPLLTALRKQLLTCAYGYKNLKDKLKELEQVKDEEKAEQKNGKSLFWLRDGINKLIHRTLTLENRAYDLQNLHFNFLQGRFMKSHSQAA